MNLKRKQNYVLSIFLLFAFFLNFLPVQPALAINNGSGTKECNLVGYRYVNNHTIRIWFDKNVGASSVNISQVKIFEGSDISGNLLDISTIAAGPTGTNYTGVSGLSGGAVVDLNTMADDAFIPGTTYTVLLNNAIESNSGLTLGSYDYNRDVTFSFTAPNSDASYSGPGIISMYPENNATNVSIENCIRFILNVPATNAAAVKAGMILKKYDTGSSNWVNLTYDATINTSKDGDIYTPIVSDDQTMFLFPMTGGGSNTSYNLDLGTQYQLDIPAITLINGQTISAQTISFTTTSDDIPLRATSLTASVNGNKIDLNWTAPSTANGVAPTPFKYYVYMSNSDSYWNFDKLFVDPIETTSYPVSDLTPGTTYYFRVTAVNGTSEGGYSNCAQAMIPVPPPTVSSAATSEDGSKVIISFNKAMNDPAGQESRFTVHVDATTDAVNEAGLNEDPSKIELSLATPIINGQAVTVDYTPGTLKAQDNGILASFTGQAVTNTVLVPAPVLSSAVTNEGGSKILLTFDKAMADPAGKETEFTVHVGGVTDNVTAAALNADTRVIELTLATSVLNGQAVTIDYEAGTVTAGDTGLLAGFIGQMVSNLVPGPAPTVTGAETNDDGSKIIISFDKSMSDPSGEELQFTVHAGLETVAVDTAALNIDPSKIELTLATPILNGQVVTLDYTTGTIKSDENGELESFTGVAVTNNVPGTPPTVISATTNTDGSKITVSFDKTMADPAGTETEFTVHVGAGTDAVTAVSLNTTTSKIDLTLTTKVTSGKTVTLDYTAGTIKAADNGVLASFTGQAVTNKVSSGGGGGGSIEKPTVDTVGVADVKPARATITGFVTSDGGDPDTERGIVYSTNSNPSISDSIKKDTKTGEGEFSLELSELTSSTTYYARAYATNSAGTGYGEEVNFTTSAANPIEFIGVYLTKAKNGDSTSDTGDSVANNNSIPTDATFKLVFDKNVSNPSTIYNNESVLDQNKSCITLLTAAGDPVDATVFKVGTGLPGDNERQNLFIKPKNALVIGQQYKIIVSADLIANNGLTIGEEQIVTFTVNLPGNETETPTSDSPETEEKPLVSTNVQVSAGGTVKASDGTQIVIPAGAISGSGNSLNIEIYQDIESSDPDTTGIGYYDPQYTERTFGPSGTQFVIPATITIPFAAANIDPADYDCLAVYLWQDGRWVKIGGIVDPTAKTISVTVSHFSTYRIMADKTSAEMRIGGSDRYETALKIAQSNFATGADIAILTRGDISADALTAVPLARHFNAPLLLTPPDQLPAQILGELKTLNVKKVYILGGEKVVGANVAAAITGQGMTVERIAGQDRFETAYKVAKLLGNVGQAVIVNGNDEAYPDALSISSWAAYYGVPILYADGTGTLPVLTAQALTELKVTRTILVGGTGVLPQALESLVPSPERYAGADRYATNAAVLSKLQAKPTKIFAVTGENFADALAGAAVAGQTNAWVLLTSSQNAENGLTAEQQQMVQTAKGTALALRILGGTGVVTDAVLNAMKGFLGL